MTQLDTIVRFVITALFDGLWQAALFAVIAWIALRAMPNANATTRHSVLAAALIASLVLPVATAAVSTFGFAWPSPSVAPSTTTTTTTHAGAVSPPRHVAVESSLERAPAPRRMNITLPRFVALGLVGAWLLGAAFVLLRLALSLLHLERLKKDSLPVPIEYRAQLLRWTAATKGSREVRLCRSNEIVIPIAVGLFDAMILVPERFLEELDPTDVDRIVLHELAHLRRADDWLNAVERVAAALLFFNPGIAWIAAQLDLEREVACDDWVLQQNDPLPYASCLAKVVETTIWPYRAMSAPGAFLTRRAMSVRIERLLTTHRDVRVRTSLGPAGLVVAAVTALGIVAAFVSPSFAYPAPAPVVAKAPAVAVAFTPHLVAAKTPQPEIRTEVINHYVTVTAPPQAAPVSAPKQMPKPAAAPTVHAIPSAVAHTVANAVSAASSAAAASASAHADRSVQVAANSPDYIDELNAAGYTNLTIDELMELKAVGVTGDYIRGIIAAGVPKPTVRELTELRALGVQPDYVRAMRQYLGSFDVRTISSLKAVGVTPEYVNDLSNAGYRNLTGRELETLKSLGIDGAFIRNAAAHGFHNLTVEQLVRLKTSGLL
jgi:beta-lactamase regulating signal transducer with metallopeptidase domain